MQSALIKFRSTVQGNHPLYYLLILYHLLEHIFYYNFGWLWISLDVRRGNIVVLGVPHAVEYAEVVDVTCEFVPA